MRPSCSGTRWGSAASRLTSSARTKSTGSSFARHRRCAEKTRLFGDVSTSKTDRFYQDMLGTNVCHKLKKRDAVSAGSSGDQQGAEPGARPHAAAAGAAAGGGRRRRRTRAVTAARKTVGHDDCTTIIIEAIDTMFKASRAAGRQPRACAHRRAATAGTPSSTRTYFMV
jgi:hypothetical protein